MTARAIWSRKYRGWELFTGFCILVLFGGGIALGQDYATHAGALITVIGILFSFAMFRERLRWQDAQVRLNKMVLTELTKLDSVLHIPPSAPELAKIRKALEGAIDAQLRKLGEEHERGLLRMEALILVFGTLVWGFADWGFKIAHHFFLDARLYSGPR